MKTESIKPSLQAPNFEEMIDLSNLLRSMFYIAMASTLLISINMLQNGIEKSDGSVFILFATTLLWFGIYQKGHQKIAGWGLLFTISVVMTYNLAVDGGIHDNGMVIYPVLIVLSGIMFGKRIVPVITAIVLAEISVLYRLTLKGVITPFQGKVTVNLQHFITIIVLLLASGILIWLTINVIEKNFLRVIKSEENLRISYDDTINGWGRALELFNEETEGHSLRVSELTVKIAADLGFDTEVIEHIQRGALLHDIGKMGISDEILQKPGKLTPEERQVIEMHPIYTYQLLKDIPFLEKALDIPLYHHERWDGTGYPNTLKGEDIPISARIFSIVDNFDALTSDRPYRSAWSYEKTIDYIREQSGIMFDPQIVDIFLRMIGADREAGSDNSTA